MLVSERIDHAERPCAPGAQPQFRGATAPVTFPAYAVSLPWPPVRCCRANSKRLHICAERTKNAHIFAEASGLEQNLSSELVRGIRYWTSGVGDSLGLQGLRERFSPLPHPSTPPPQRSRPSVRRPLSLPSKLVRLVQRGSRRSRSIPRAA